MPTNNSYDDAFDAAGKKYNVDPQLLKTIFHVESSGNPNTRPSSAGAIGGMQIMPQTARILKTDPTDMNQAIPAAAKYIRQGLDAHQGDPVAALRYYNGGPGGPSNPATLPYVNQAANLYDKMKVNPSGVDPSVQAGHDIIQQSLKPAAPIQGTAPAQMLAAPTIPGKAPAQMPAAPVQTAPIDPGVQAGHDIIQQTMQANPVPTSAAPAAAVNPQTGQADTMAPALRNMLQQAPGFTYGNVLPLKRNDTTGEYSMTVPGAVRDFAGGALDLAEGPTTGTVTPQGTMALGSLMASNPAAFGSPASAAAEAARKSLPDLLAGQTAKAAKEAAAQPNMLSPEFKAAPTAPGMQPSNVLGDRMFSGISPTADPTSAATSKFADALQGYMAKKIGAAIGSGAGGAIGHMIDPTKSGAGMAIGGAMGGLLEPVVQEMMAKYGPRATNAVIQALKNRGVNMINMADPENPRYTLPSFQGSPDSPLHVPPSGPVYMRQQQKGGGYVPLA